MTVVRRMLASGFLYQVSMSDITVESPMTVESSIAGQLTESVSPGF